MMIYWLWSCIAMGIFSCGITYSLAILAVYIIQKITLRDNLRIKTTKLNCVNREFLNSTMLWSIQESGICQASQPNLTHLATYCRRHFETHFSRKVFHFHSNLTEFGKGPVWKKKSLSVQVMAWRNVTSHRTRCSSKIIISEQTKWRFPWTY